MFKGTLFEAQLPTAEFLCSKRRALLGSEQGTGKTIVSIACREKLIELGKINTGTLVLTPTALAWQFGDKIKEFTDATCQVSYANRKESRSYRSGEGSIDYFVVPYSLFLRDFDDIVSSSWDLVIADEAEAFSNNKSKTYKKMLALNRAMDPGYRFALTGTAISNKIEDLYTIMYWVDKHFLPPWPDFERQHIKRHRAFKSIIGYKNLKGLNKYVKHRMVRLTHADLKGQMPELVTIEHFIAPDIEYRIAEANLLGYLDDAAENLEFTEEGELKNAKLNPKLSKAFHAARQALITQSKIDYFVALCRRLLDENPQNRIVGFSYYKDPIYRLQKELADKGLCQEAPLFTGDQTAEQKHASISRFKDESTSRVLLCSNAGARGLDLPWAKYIINLDVPFSWGLLDQRNKRITRAGSKYETVVAYYLMVEDSLEAFYYQVVLNKGKLATAVLEDGEDEIVMKTESLRQYLNG